MISDAMRKYILFFILLISSIPGHAQDIIIRTDGQKVFCKVLESDSVRVYFILNSRNLKTFLSKSEISEIQIGKPAPDYQGALTLGFMEGGASLLGFDCERMISKSVSFQLGAGVIGFGLGINKHFKPNIRSSFVSLQYWHQGFGNSYTQSMIGPCVVVRSNTWFTFQVGVGYALGKGPAWPENKSQSPIMLTYAVGIYFPSF
jgi:hypothetical protein